MKILVTGASGFLGMNLLHHLAQAHPDATLVAADLTAPAEQDIAQLACANRIEWRTLDVCDARACHNLLAGSRPEYIVHGAAVTLAEQGNATAELTRNVNLVGTENLLRAAVAAGSVKRCLLLSSSGVYCQSGEAVACDEDHPLDLANVYAQAKREAESLMSSAFPMVAVRIGPVYGPFERSRPTRPRVSMIRRLLDFLQSGQCICVNGTDMQRDWTHGADIAAGLSGLLFSPTLNHRIYNLSAGEAVSAREVLALCVEQGLKVRWTSEEQADIVLNPCDTRKPLAIERLRRDTGFQPGFDIRAGLADLWSPKSA